MVSNLSKIAILSYMRYERDRERERETCVNMCESPPWPGVRVALLVRPKNLLNSEKEGHVLCWFDK